MKKYPNCVHKLFYEPLIITPSRHAALCKVLEARMAAPMPMPMPESEPDEDDGQIEVIGSDAVIPVHGVITAHASDIPASSCGCGLDTVSSMIDAARSESGIDRIIFHFRTPGGGVTGTPEMAAKIAGIRDKATIAYTDDECCSAGVWLATQCQYFYAMPSAAVGSIGVWCAYLDASRQLANEGLNVQAISAGKYKLMGASWKPLSADETAILQAGVDKIYAQFKAAVNLNREVSEEFMQAQIFDGREACDIGLCDGTYDSLDELRQALGEDGAD